MDPIFKLIDDERGATTIEYGAIASLISIIAIGAFMTIGTGVGALFASVPGF